MQRTKARIVQAYEKKEKGRKNPKERRKRKRRRMKMKIKWAIFSAIMF